MNFRLLSAAVTAATIMSSTGYAAVVSAGGLLPAQVNDQNVGSTQASPDTAFVRSLASGRLDSFTIWATSSSLNGISGDGLSMTIFGRDDGRAPDFVDSLASQTFDANFLSAAPIVTSFANTEYRAITWDLSGLDIMSDFGDYFGFRMAPNGATGSVDVSSLFCTFASNSCGQARDLGVLLDRNGTDSSFGTPSSQFVWMYQLNVDDNPMPDLAPVPLPAGLPLLLAGLGGLSVLRRRG